MDQELHKEKIETFLAIAGIFGLSGNKDAADTFELPESFHDWSAFPPETIEMLRDRAAALNRAPSERRNVWLALWHERLRRRGRTRRLDPNVHAEQIAYVLEEEPPAVRMIIESHLPDEMAKKVAIILQSTSLHSFVKSKGIGTRLNLDPAMIEIVRSRFLANFVAFEDLFRPSEIEKFTTRELGNFLWKLGLREIGFLCRGISRKENLAGFLKQFEEEIAKEIGNFISSAGQVSHERVRVAEERAKRVFPFESGDANRVRGMGMEIFSEILSRKPDAIVRYNLQKLPLTIADRLSERITDLKTRLPDKHANAVADEIEELARNFGTEGLK